MYCQYCGVWLRDNANFCHQCGATVKNEYTHVSTPTTVVGGVIPLFDPRRRYYFIKQRWWGWGSGSIYDETGNTIGHLYRRIISLRKTIEFREADNHTISAIIHRKIVAIRDTYDVKDGQDQMLARVKQKILTFFRPVMWMEDPHRNKILEAKGNFLGFNFKVHDMKGNLVAEIDKADKWRDIFFGGTIFDFHDKYTIFVHSDIDRRLIVPFAIAIDEAVHEDVKR